MKRESKASLVRVEKESGEGTAQIPKKAGIITFYLIVKGAPEDKMQLSQAPVSDKVGKSCPKLNPGRSSVHVFKYIIHI